MIRLLKNVDSTSSSVVGFFDSQSDVQILPEYNGVPDYGADEEPDLVHCHELRH